MITKKHRSKGGESNTHKTQNKSTITHTKPQLEFTTQLEEFSTQMGLKSLSQRIECARMESWCFGMIKECLGCSSMRLGVPFIAPKQLGAVGSILGRPKLPSVGWRTGQSGAPLDSYCSCPVPDSFPNRAATDRCRLVAVGASDTVRCTSDSPVPPADRWSEPRVARGFGDRPSHWWPLAHRTVWCTTGQSGEL
jgi:hypothetical protein